MGAFEDLLKRQGYVKLDQYGLVLTADDRILSTRAAVLDDGHGGKIVGWSDGDLAAAELDHWGAARKPAAPPAAARRVAATTGLHSVRQFGPPPAPPRVAKPAVVAAEPVVEEDEWEWEIAMARARAVADDVQTAAATIATSFTAPRPAAKPAPAPNTQKRTMQMGVVAPVMAKGTAPIAAEPLPSWPTTEPLTPAPGPGLRASWSDATRESAAPAVMSPAAKQLAVVKSAARTTVIPVPKMPVAAKPSDVRPTSNTIASPPRLAAQARTRLARGTQPQGQSEDTVVTAAIPPAVHDDHTAPYVMLPAEVKPTGYAHTTRVAAKYR